MTAPGAEITTDAAQARPGRAALPLHGLQAIALLFLVAKLVLLAVQQPFMDETYYFLWGQHPALSYYDHPGLIGWIEGISGALFGWNVVALRFPVFLTLLGDVGFSTCSRGGFRGSAGKSHSGFRPHSFSPCRWLRP